MPENSSDRFWLENSTLSVRLLMSGGLLCLFWMPINAMMRACTRGDTGDRMFMLVLFVLLFLGLLAVLCFSRQSVSPMVMLVSGALLALALVLRAACLNEVSGDYVSFLSGWMEKLRQGGGFAALSGLNSDYNVPYLYLLAAASYVPVDDLLLIKAISIVCDVLMACAVVGLARRLGLALGRRLVLFGAALLAPTIWLNSALWAQCDVIYLLFALLSFQSALDDHPWRSVALAGLGFAFKLQIIFFLPMLLIFLLTRKLKIRHMLALPAVYLLVGLPALALGRSFASLFTIYSTQVSQYSPYLNLNAPSAYAFLSSRVFANQVVTTGEAQSSNAFFYAGIAAAAAFLLLLFYYLFSRRATLNNKMLITLALLFCAGLPWCLPSMHERYFYMADVFSLLYAVAHPHRFYVAPMMIFASYAGYHAYIVREHLPLSMWMPALLVLAVVVCAVIDLLRQAGEAACEKISCEGVPTI